MSRFIDRLNRLSRAESQPIGFRATQPVSPRPQMQLVVSLTEESTGRMGDDVTGADAGLLGISASGSGAGALKKLSEGRPDIPWGGRLEGNGLGDIEQLLKAGCDFVVFPAASTPMTLPQKNEAGRILEVEASLSEGLLRAVNELPIDAVLIAGEGGDGYFLTWQHLMLFRRFADLLTKPLLVSVPSGVTAGELQVLWGVGVGGVVVAVAAGQPQNRFKELRQIIDKLVFPSSRRQAEPLLRRPSQKPSLPAAGEEEEEEE